MPRGVSASGVKDCPAALWPVMVPGRRNAGVDLMMPDWHSRRSRARMARLSCDTAHLEAARVANPRERGHWRPFADRGGGESAMRRYGLVRVLTVVALMATLLMGVAAPASAMERPQAGKAWSWLETLWRAGVSVWAPWGPRKPEVPTVRDKGGPCVDPNGCAGPETATTSTSRPTCTAAEGGPCVDPNG